MFRHRDHVPPLFRWQGIDPCLVLAGVVGVSGLLAVVALVGSMGARAMREALARPTATRSRSVLRSRAEINVVFKG